jgi:SOS-response transcriptional repressor LexA
MDQNEEIFVRYMNDEPFQEVVSAWMASEAYRRLRTRSPDRQESDSGSRPVNTLRLVEGTAEERYVSCVPLVPLEAAAGAFGDPQHLEPDDQWQWVAPGCRRRLAPGMFVAQVVGRSMEPAIADGAYGLFRAPVEGTRQGKIVLVELQDATDPETGARYTVKRYRSEKAVEGDSWRHTRILLEPLNPEFEPIVCTGNEAGELRVVAELLEVIGAGPIRPEEGGDGQGC